LKGDFIILYDTYLLLFVFVL